MLSRKVVFRQLFDKNTSTYTYLLGCKKTRECVLIDPVWEHVDRDLQLVKELKLDLVYGINTHCHADHVTGTGAIKERLPKVKSVFAKSEVMADIWMSNGDDLEFGDGITINFRSTPGHTTDCMSLYCKEIQSVFTGDAVLIRGCGRTDFQGGSSETLYKSVHRQIFSLPEETFIYPAHDYKGRTVSTVGEEKAHNPRLSKSLKEFQEIMAKLQLGLPKMIHIAVPANVKCGIGFDGIETKEVN